MKKTTNKIKKLVATILAFAMMISVFSVSAPTEVQATGLAFKGKGSTTITLTGNQLGREQYIKFKSGVTGTITLTFKDFPTSSPTGELQILNGKKKPLAPVENWWISALTSGYTRTYGVKKGKTYYFLVKTDDDVQVKATVKAVKKYNCTSKKQAKTIKKGKKLTSVLIAGEKKADWYKFKVEKNKNVCFTIKVKTNGFSISPTDVWYYNSKFNISFYNAKGEQIKFEYVRKYPMTISLTEQKYAFYVPKGTCYIKIEPYTNYTSGQYTIIWRE